MFFENGKPLKLTLLRGGDRIKGRSLLIKNKKLAVLVAAIFSAKIKVIMAFFCYFKYNID
jgi:hypothetical protein